MSQGPAVSRRRLGAELRRLRDAAGLTIDQAAHELECSVSKISRLETGKGLPKQRDVRDLARLYGKEAEQGLERLLDWARAGSRAGWWQEYTSVLNAEPFVLEGVDRYVALESDASAIRTFAVPCVYGLLQTADYARAILETVLPHHAVEDIDRLVELRLRRQDVVLRTDEPASLHVVFDESVFHRTVGDEDVMRRQIERVVELAARPNIIVQVLPFDSGFTRASGGPFSVLEFRESVDQDVVYVESQAGNAYLEGDFGVEKYRSIFDDARRRALSPAESDDWMMDKARRMRSGSFASAPGE